MQVYVGRGWFVVSQPSDGQTPEGPNLTGYIKKTDQWPIGTGAFTDVYKGEWLPPGLSTPNPVAIKIFRGVHTDKENHEKIKRRLIRESRAWYGLDHANIQPYFGYCNCNEIGPSLSLISPFCQNGTLINYLNKYPATSRFTLLGQIISGLKYLHEHNVIHGDLHGKNVLIDDHGKVRLADFGRARVIGHEGYSTALVAGCTEYMAPELFPDDPGEDDESELDLPFSTSSDIYALAMLTFEIFTGLTPFSRGGRPSHPGIIIRRICRGDRPTRKYDFYKRISDDLWNKMEACWNACPQKRLTADDLDHWLTNRSLPPT